MGTVNDNEADDAPLPIRLRWVRARLEVPDLERLLGSPIGARISDNFDSLHVRVSKAVDRIGEEASGAITEICQKATLYRRTAMVSAAVMVAAGVTFVSFPAFRLPAILILVAEAIAVVIIGRLQRVLARDLIALDDLRTRFQSPLEAARSPDDLHRLAEKIRREMTTVVQVQKGN